MRFDVMAEGVRMLRAGLVGSAPEMAPVQPPLVDEAPEPWLARRLLVVSGAGFLVLLAWAGLAPLDEVARAGGMLVARGNNGVVQHAEGGLLRTLWVREGQSVVAGQPLLDLDDTAISADLASVRNRIAYLGQQQRKLGLALGLPPETDVGDTGSDVGSDAGHAGLLPPPAMDAVEPAAGADPQMASLEQRRRLMEENILMAGHEVTRQRDLLRQGFGTLAKVYAAERDHRALNESLAALRSEQGGQLDETRSDLTQQREQERKLEDRLGRCTLRAPFAGTVQNLRVGNAGTVVGTGVTLMEIVPDGAPLEAVVKLSPADVGMVRVGQRVAVKVTAYDSSHFGVLDGRVSRISADAMTDAGNQPVFQVWVEVPQRLDERQAGGGYALRPGMMVVAAIVTGQRTVLDYLLKPIRKTLDEAWRET